MDGARANALPDPVPESLKQERYQRFMETQAAISRERLSAKIGQLLPVLIEQVNGDTNEGGAVGRSPCDAPEIDGQVFFDTVPAVHNITPGQRVMARVTDADDYDLWAEIVADENHIRA